MKLENATVRDHAFLADMFADAYFPKTLVGKGKQILVELCAQIEREQPEDEAEILALTHAATERFNELAEEFAEQGSEIETAAREAIAADFEVVLRAYRFDVDLEDAISPRDW